MPALPHRLDGDLVVLRRWAPADAGAVAAAITASLDALRPWLPWAQEPPEPDAQREVLLRLDRGFDDGTAFVYGIFEPDGGVVGGAGLHLDRPPAPAEVGYWVRTDRHRRGYATEAAALLTGAAFAHLAHVDAVHITIDPANTASAGVARALGYRLVGEEPRPPAAPGEAGLAQRWVMERRRWSRR